MNEKNSISIRTVLFYITATILVFFYIYMSNLSMFGLPAQLHSLRLSAIIIVLWGAIKGRRMPSIDKSSTAYRSWLTYVKVVIALFIYSILLLVLVGKGEGSTFFDSMNNMVFFTLPVVWAFTRIFDNVTQFMRVLLLVGIVQSIIIIYCLINDSFALFLDLTFNLSETDYTASHRGGYAGGLGCITAPGVIRYSTGLIACVFFYLREHKSIYLIIFTMFAILSSMIARTGILIDIACLVAIVLAQSNVRKLVHFLIPLAIIIYFINSVVSTGKYDDFLGERYARLSSLQENGMKDSFWSNYLTGENTSFPPLNMDMLIGTGIVSGISSNGYIVNVDGGPLRIYSAAGIIVCSLFYTFMLKLLFSNTRIQNCHNDKILMWLYMAILLISDFKELTFFIVYPMCIYYTCALLISKDNKIRIQ